MRKVVLLRHGQTDWNAQGRFQGQSDIELNDEGRFQAARIAPLLASLKPAAVIASDLKRARDTALEVCRYLPSLALREDPRLRETNGGQWEGKDFLQIQRDYAELFPRWEAGEPGIRAGETGETRAEVAERVSAAVLDALSDVPDGGVLLVASHGAAIKAGLLKLIGVPFEFWRSFSGLSNCHWSVVEETFGQEGTFKMTEFNAGSLPEPAIGEEG